MVLLIAFFGSILTYFVVIKKTSFIALFLLMVLFGFSMIMFAFMMTSLFNKAKVGDCTRTIWVCEQRLETLPSFSRPGSSAA